MPDDVRRVFESMQQRQAFHFRDFGHLVPIKVSEYHDRTVFFAGSRVFLPPKTTARTVQDVLYIYLGATFGEEWRKTEAARPEGDRHPVVDWLRSRADGIRRGVQTGDGLVGIVPTGGVVALLLLSYELFALESTGNLQEKFVARLKDRAQFQGARYELTVFAALARAGFKIELEDEGDPASQHVECTGIHRETGQRLAVEAKSRHRTGVLGYRGPSRPERWKGLDEVLKRAFKKPSADPLAVFIDLNVPAVGPEAARDEWSTALDRATAGAMRRMRLEPGRDQEPFNMVVATNNPLHYAGEGELVPGPGGVSILARSPRRPITHAAALADLQGSVEKMGKIPTSFA